MKTKRTLRRIISSETKQIEFYAKSKKQSAEQCEICEELSPMFSPEFISEIFLISKREIYRNIELQRVHFVEIGRTEVFVCLKSLMLVLKRGHFQIEKFKK